MDKIRGMVPLALEEVDKVVTEGEITHKKDTWRNGDLKELIEKHVSHGFNHMYAFDFMPKDINEDLNDKILEISHATTRYLMILQLLLEKRVSAR